MKKKKWWLKMLKDNYGNTLIILACIIFRITHLNSIFKAMSCNHIGTKRSRKRDKYSHQPILNIWMEYIAQKYRSEIKSNVSKLDFAFN